MDNLNNAMALTKNIDTEPPVQMPFILPAGGPPLFNTDLFIPMYQDGKWGDWEIKTAKLILDHGYHSGLWLVQNLQVLSKRSKNDDTLPSTWMSPSPHEIESQELGCRHAFGHTVVMGLGLGWCAINIALNPLVDKVTVLELDPVVIELITSIKVMAQAPKEARNKIRIIQADALKWQPDEPVDFIYADIWRSLGEAETLDHVRKMQSNINAKQIYFWGQELFIYTQAKKHWNDFKYMNNDLAKKCIEEIIGLPLLVPPETDYGDMIERIVRNRHARRLPLER